MSHDVSSAVIKVSAGLAEARHADLFATELDVFRVEILVPVSCREYSKAAGLRAPLTRYNSCV
jgi:hypothetical protein